MFESQRAALVTAMVNRWLRRSRLSWRGLPVPAGPPAAHWEGPDPDRILLFGSGIAVGYGATTHHLALAGQIARQVSDITHRGVQVDVVAGESLSTQDVLNHLTVRRLRELDAIITTPGSLEHMLLLPVSVWRDGITEQLDHFAANAPASLRVIFVAIPEVSRIFPVPWLLGLLADRSARALNRELQRLCASRPYVEFVPFVPTERAGRTGTGRTYEQWAALIAPSVATALNDHQKVSTG